MWKDGAQNHLAGEWLSRDQWSKELKPRNSKHVYFWSCSMPSLSPYRWPLTYQANFSLVQFYVAVDMLGSDLLWWDEWFILKLQSFATQFWLFSAAGINTMKFIPCCETSMLSDKIFQGVKLLASDGEGDELETAEPLHGALSSWETAYKHKLPVTLIGIPEATI